jgi:hypothetical protein
MWGMTFEKSLRMFWPKGADVQADGRYISERRCCSVCDRQKVCHVCGTQTLMACSDCRLNFGAVIYVCTNTVCRAEHERKCYGSKP